MRLRVVVLPLFVGGLLATLVGPLAGWLRRHHIPNGVAALAAVLGAVGGVLAVVAATITFVLTDSDRLSNELSESVDQFAAWLSDGPFDLSERDVEKAREDLGREADDAVRRWARSGGLLKSTITIVEVLAGAILAVLISFFLVKDRDRLANWALKLWPTERRDQVQATAEAAVHALRGYLRGCAILGLVEAVAIGGTVAVLATPTTGAPIAVLTFLAAFVPILGAVAAGVLAVLVTLAAAGPLAALVVAGVVLMVQQLDNDVLAPVILGRTTRLHPLAILIAITAGSSLAGLAGAFVAVPLTAMVSAMLGAWRDQQA